MANTIRDSKMTKVYTAIENAYPDISGSAQSTAWSKKSYAMHVYELPDDILTGEPDPKVYLQNSLMILFKYAKIGCLVSGR